MGMAATQARFLCITARKQQCEYKSADLAQQKLEITDRLTQISNDYNTALNQTKLVWDNDIVPVAESFSYSLLMTPSVNNDFNPYMISTPSGAVVLNSEYAAAAKAAGISRAGGGKGSQQGRDTFINNLVGAGIVTNETAKVITYYDSMDVKEEIQNEATRSGVAWNSMAGLGSDPLNKTSALAVDLYSFMNTDIGQLNIELKDDYQYYSCGKGHNTSGSGTSTVKSVADLLSSDCVLYKTYTDGLTDEKKKTFLVDTIDYMADLVEKVFGVKVEKDDNLVKESKKLTDLRKAYKVSPIVTEKGFNIDDASLEALSFAFRCMVIRLTKEPQTIGNLNMTGDGNNSYEAQKNAAEMNNVCEVDGKGFAVNLSNLISIFMTQYEQNLDNGVFDFYIGSTRSDSSFVTDDPTYMYLMADSDRVSENSVKIADFFDQLYNNIVEHGWKEDESIEDSEFLINSLKNGRYTMLSLNNDGYYYQSRYNQTGYVVEVADTDAIARAEAEFTALRADLTAKENRIDIKNKQIDAELSSLTTEYDSVKTMLGNNISKIFAQFQ